MERPRNPGDDVVHLIAGRDNSWLRHEGFATAPIYVVLADRTPLFS
jgi:hypothetical protein